MPGQFTVNRSVSLDGVGLHNGDAVKVRLDPAPPGTGVRFRHLGYPERPPLPATIDVAVDARLATTLGQDGWRVSTVEHLLSAVWGLGIDNLDVWLDGDELPVLDGSALGWVAALDGAGRARQDARRTGWVVDTEIAVHDGASSIRVTPAESLELAVAIDFDHPAIGRQSIDICLSPDTFQRELAWARTFGFAAQVEAMRAAGLARGGSLENALVFGELGPINEGGVRGAGEVVRHKALDLVGDLALLGRPLRARVEAVRPGHAINQRLVALVRAQAHATDWSSGR